MMFIKQIIALVLLQYSTLYTYTGSAIVLRFLFKYMYIIHVTATATTAIPPITVNINIILITTLYIHCTSKSCSLSEWPIVTLHKCHDINFVQMSENGLFS
jgi:hypothetical protein